MSHYVTFRQCDIYVTFRCDILVKKRPNKVTVCCCQRSPGSPGSHHFFFFKEPKVRTSHEDKAHMKFTESTT